MDTDHWQITELTLTNETDQWDWSTKVTTDTDQATLTSDTDQQHWLVTLTSNIDQQQCSDTDQQHWLVTLTSNTAQWHWPSTLTSDPASPGIDCRMCSRRPSLIWHVSSFSWRRAMSWRNRRASMATHASSMRLSLKSNSTTPRKSTVLPSNGQKQLYNYFPHLSWLHVDVASSELYRMCVTKLEPLRSAKWIRKNRKAKTLISHWVEESHKLCHMSDDIIHRL